MKSFYDEEWGEVVLKFSTPAVQDFLYNFLKENTNQYIPLIIYCSRFYNQLLFLLEHFLELCTDNLKYSIIISCIHHYDYYSDSLLEDNNGLQFDVFDMVEQYGTLNRIFHLIRCGDLKNQPELFQFVEEKIKNYCMMMGSEDSIQDQYYDLQNLPDIIFRCVEKGITFNGLVIMEKYYDEAFSINHYSAFKKFKNIFPQEYVSFESKCSGKKLNIKQIVFWEVDFLEEYGMEFELDILLDNLSDAFEKLGMHYTKEFEDKIYEICGRKPYKYEWDYVPHKNSEDNVFGQEEDFHEVMWQAREWLFGPRELDLEDEMVKEIVRSSNLIGSIKSTLLSVIETSSPYYMYNIITSNNSVYLLIDALVESGNSEFPKTEGELSAIIITYICGNNMNISGELIAFCAECFTLFINQDKAVIRTKEFFSSDIYNIYLKDNQKLKEIVFNYLVFDDGKWILFKNVLLFIFSFAVYLAYENINGEDISDVFDVFRYLFEDNFIKLKKLIRTDSGQQQDIFYTDSGCYSLKNYEWEGSLCRLLAEFSPIQFLENYVQPKLKSYLKKVDGEDHRKRIEKYLKDIHLSYIISEEGEVNGSKMQINEVLSLIEHLYIAELPYELFNEIYIETEKIEEWKEQGFLVKNYSKEWELKLFEITDFNVIRKLGLDKQIREFLDKLEEVAYTKPDFVLNNFHIHTFTQKQ